MISTTKKKIISITEVLHLRIFGHEMSDTMREFLGHLSWSFFGGIVAAGIMLMLNILAGRILGPEEYGKYSFIAAFSSVVVLFMTLGIDVTILHYISKNNNESNQGKYLSTAFFVLLFFSTACFTILVLFRGIFAKKLGIESDVYFFAVIFTLVLAFKNLFDAYLRGLNMFRKQAFFKIIEAITVGIIFISMYFLLSKSINYSAYIGALIVAAFLLVFLIYINIKKYFRLDSYSFTVLKEISSYGNFVLLGGIAATMLTSFDKILINKFLGEAQLGLYNAYFISSMALGTQFAMIIINVFFPMASFIENKNSILEKINKLSMILFVPAFILSSAIIRVALFLFGKQYVVSWNLIMQFGLLSVVYIYFTIFWWFIASYGVRGIRFTSINGLISGAIFIILVVFFRAIINISMVVSLLNISLIYAIISGNIILRKNNYLN